jgi:feruloyl esterase
MDPAGVRSRRSADPRHDRRRGGGPHLDRPSSRAIDGGTRRGLRGDGRRRRLGGRGSRHRRGRGRPRDRAGRYPVCDVKGVIAPQIQFEVQLPTQTYRQRYLQTGCGGLCGSPRDQRPLPRSAARRSPTAPSPPPPTTRDTSAAAPPTATSAPTTRCASTSRYRADHLTALAAKALITAFYGHAPRYSYFDGCSQGGHEALTEAQRYPHDFDGILAGAPASITTELNGFNQPWLARVDFDAAGRVILPASKLPALHAAVMARCDGLDGLVDGQLDDPRRCPFDPATLTCPAGTDNDTCLTPAQLTVVRKIYSGAVDAATGTCTPAASRTVPNWSGPAG